VRKILPVLILSLAVGLCVSVSKTPQKTSTPSFDYLDAQIKKELALKVKNFEFTHPMTVINKAELDIVKQKIKNNTEPQASAYKKLIEDAEAAQDFTPHPTEEIYMMGRYTKPYRNLDAVRKYLWANCHAAYASALAYSYCGDEKYADKAIEVLNAWAVKGSIFTGGDRGLQLGSWFSPMLYAADLLYYYPGWEAQDKKKFKQWWRQNCLVHTYEIMYRKDNNWKDAGMLGVLSAAVVLEDKELLLEAVTELRSYFVERNDDKVKMSGLWKIRKDDRGVYLPREVVRDVGRKGVTYTAYALTTMVQAFEIARYASFDFWHLETPEGATIQEVIEWYFRWNILEHEFPWRKSPNKSDKRYNCYEIANNHFTIMPEMAEWLSRNRPVVGREGDEYVTLNKGNITPVSIKTP